MNWLKRNYWFVTFIFAVSLIPTWVIAEIVHYNLEP